MHSHERLIIIIIIDFRPGDLEVHISRGRHRTLHIETDSD